MVSDQIEAPLPDKRSAFIARGFSDPDVLDYLERNFASADTLSEKFNQLQERGVPDPRAAVAKHPELASRDIPRVFQVLEEHGIRNIGKNVGRCPQLADVDIVRVIKAWKEVGIIHPEHAISIYPQMAGFNPQTVIEKLTSAGLRNPVSVIERYPPIVGLAKERIAKRVTAMTALCATVWPNADPEKLLEENPQLFGYNINRIVYNLRIAKHFHLEPKSIIALLKKNPYLLLRVASREVIPTGDLFMKQAHAITRLDKDKRDDIIAATKESLLESIQTLKEQFQSEKIDPAKTEEQKKNTLLCLSLARTLQRQLALEQMARTTRAETVAHHTVSQFKVIGERKKPRYVEKTIPIPFDDTIAS